MLWKFVGRRAVINCFNYSRGVTVRKMATTSRVEKLRALMKDPAVNIQAYIIPTDDPHMSEYIAESEKRRQYISNFTGSAGTAVVTLTEALLWTDGRYWLQAGMQLDANWKLMKDRVADQPTVGEYLAKNLPSGSRIGIDPKLVSKAEAQRHTATLEQNNHKLVYLSSNLVDQVWDTRCAPPTNPIMPHTLQYSGRSLKDKITSIRQAMNTEGVDAMVVSALDEVAWVLNIRGSDIPFNPVVMSYLLITHNAILFFVDGVKANEELKSHLGAHVKLLPYNSIFGELEQLREAGKRIWLDPRSSMALVNSAGGGSDTNLIFKATPINMEKALKNGIELEGLRNCHVRDAAALIKFFAWLENELNNSNTGLDECSVSDKLEEFRSKQPDFVSLSFETIAGSGPNGAIIHYKPEKPTCAKIEISKMFLCDSGGQYSVVIYGLLPRDGTTDVTRTLHFGSPSHHERECYTRVLLGHIALGSVVFPAGLTTGKDVDLLARMHLWQSGLDYAHGTGHGVGAFLNVHEGPQSISFRAGSGVVPLAAGMTVTNEPGYYEEGNFGIRIENVMVVAPVETKHNNGNFLGFEQLTLVPYDSKLIDKTLITERDVAYINSYHKICLEKVGPLLKDDSLATKWLQKHTETLAK